MNIKEKLLSALGTVGFILYYLIAILLIVVPLAAIGLPWWADFLIIAAICSFPVIGSFLCVGVYAWSFVIVIQEPFSIFSVVYFVFFAIYLIFFFIPTIINLFSK